MFSTSDLEHVESAALVELDAVPMAAFLTQYRGESSKEVFEGFQNLADVGPTLLAYRNGDRSVALSWARGFVISFLRNIRGCICGPSSSQPPTTLTAKGAASAVAAWAMSHFGLSSPLAIGVAALVIVTIGTSTKAAFCSMTDDEVMRSLQK